MKKGIKKGDKVVHFMMNSIDWLVAYFGIIRTGAWVVPLNFRFTAEDVKYCCDVAEPAVVVFDEEFTDRIDAIKAQLPTVKEYICVGNKIPALAEVICKTCMRAHRQPPQCRAITPATNAVFISLPAQRGSRNRFS